MCSNEAYKLLNEKFNKDTLISLATSLDNVPTVRTVNSYYEDGKFYIVTHNSTTKMKHIAENPSVSVCSEQWFTAQGMGENLGYICDDENKELAEKLRKEFASWYFNGHTNESDPNTVILCVHLTRAILYHQGERFDINFR